MCIIKQSSRKIQRGVSLALAVLIGSFWIAATAHAVPCIDCEAGGGESAEPLSPPPRPFFLQANVPLYWEGVNQFAWYSCRQLPHVWVGPSNDVAQGTTVYPTGVVVPGTRASFGFYNAAGQLVASHVTRPARGNCVIHHEPEAMSTAGLTPGYYYVYASYWSMSPARIVPPDSFNGYAASHTGRYITMIRVR